MNTQVRLFRNRVRSHFGIIILLTGLLCLWSTQAMAQAEPSETEVTDQPGFISELVDKTELKQEQVEQMRSSGAGWGNIMIATRLAERIAADSEGLLTFDEALEGVLKSRAEGKGFGQIANENDLKLGRVLEGDDNGTPDGTNPPPFIAELVEKTELTPEQVEQMRSGGAGWGNIMIATRLAERIAADSEGVLTFDEALEGVLEARAEDKGFGQIANENDLKLGRVVGKGNKSTTTASDAGGTEEGAGGSNVIINRGSGKAKKQNAFGRLLSFLGFGKQKRYEKTPKAEKLERPERPHRHGKPEKPERPEKPEKPERPERPEKPEKPEKPARPGR
jgi:hypothetical protein